MVGVAFVLSIIISYFILKKMNKNTIGTTQAYFKRAFTVWVITWFVLMAILCGL